MKRTLGTCVALLSAATMSVSVANAADKPDKPPTAKNLASKQCVALKQADRAAFNALYGPKQAMRNCKKAETGKTKAEQANAAKQCKAEQAADPVLFEETYGDDDPYTASTPNAFGKCVSSKASAEDDEDTTEFKNAAKECKAERAADADAFAETYGSNKNKKNALGKCVSQKVKAAATA